MTQPRTFTGDSLHDLTDPHNLGDAREGFRRARDLQGTAALCAWAIEWGGAALNAIEDLQIAAEDCTCKADDGEPAEAEPAAEPEASK